MTLSSRHEFDLDLNMSKPSKKIENNLCKFYDNLCPKSYLGKDGQAETIVRNLTKRNFFSVIYWFILILC